MELSPSKLESLLGKVVNELGTAANGVLIFLGDKLGLFRALAEGPPTPPGLPKRPARMKDTYRSGFPRKRPPAS